MRDVLLIAAVILIVLYIYTGRRIATPHGYADGYAEYATTIPMTALQLPINVVRDLIVSRLGYKPDAAPTLVSWEIVSHAGDDFVVLARTVNTPGH